MSPMWITVQVDSPSPGTPTQPLPPGIPGIPPGFWGGIAPPVVWPPQPLPPEYFPGSPDQGLPGSPPGYWGGERPGRPERPARPGQPIYLPPGWYYPRPIDPDYGVDEIPPKPDQGAPPPTAAPK
jgi:hypothetical protein